MVSQLSCQPFWEIMKSDLLSLFSALHSGQLELFRLNFGKIILLPKIAEAKRIQQYRPICLLNVSFNHQSCNSKAKCCGWSCCPPISIAFMQGRNIFNGVVILHETVHELHRKKLNVIIFKIDFEKAYDKVKWSFLQQTLKIKVFFWRVACSHQ
jgi:hypothetical protein